MTQRGYLVREQCEAWEQAHRPRQKSRAGSKPFVNSSLRKLSFPAQNHMAELVSSAVVAAVFAVSLARWCACAGCCSDVMSSLTWAPVETTRARAVTHQQLSRVVRRLRGTMTDVFRGRPPPKSLVERASRCAVPLVLLQVWPAIADVSERARINKPKTGDP